MIIKRTLGMPGRVLRSPHAERIVAAEAAGAPKDDIVAMIAGAMNALGTDDGDLDGSYVWAGQCVGLFDQVESAGAVVARMAAEAAAGMARLRGLFP
jgi:enoyl-[acyl-carrier protein] reductase II